MKKLPASSSNIHLFPQYRAENPPPSLKSTAIYSTKEKTFSVCFSTNKRLTFKCNWKRKLKILTKFFLCLFFCLHLSLACDLL
jgi:hypothetical protein